MLKEGHRTLSKTQYCSSH